MSAAVVTYVLSVKTFLLRWIWVWHFRKFIHEFEKILSPIFWEKTENILSVTVSLFSLPQIKNTMPEHTISVSIKNNLNYAFYP